MGTPTGRGSATLATRAPFAPPANIDDLDEVRLKGWSAVVSAWLDGAVRRVTEETGDPRFFNPVRTPPPAEPAERKIVWDAFPRTISVAHPGDPEAARAAADEPDDLGSYFGVRFFQVRDGREEEVVLPFRRHDEYCEWFAETDAATGRPRRYVFTCEGPEYWRFIASGTTAVVDRGAVPASARVDGDRALLLRLYRALVGPQVREADLYHEADVQFRQADGTVGRYRAAGQYNPNNKWNTTHGIVHLTHPSNTLSAEIFLAADASVPRADAKGVPVTDAAKLICCAGYGEPNRSSDPTIGADVNDLVRGGLSVSLRDPIGLYLDALDTTALSGPDGEDVSGWWRLVRGADRLTLRAEFAAPEGAPFGLDDVLVNGVPLTRAGQLAELITMSLYGIGADFGAGAPAPIGCSAHGCAQVGQPDLLTLVKVGENCPDGWAEAFPDSSVGGAAPAAVAAAGGSARTPTAAPTGTMAGPGRRRPGLSEILR